MRAPELIRGLSVPCPFGGNAPPFRPPVLPAIREGGPPLPLLPHRRPERGVSPRTLWPQKDPFWGGEC